MEYFRQKVSGNKKRYIDLDFNLDLSYITPRIIAMAIPGEGFDKIYRNNIYEVQSFLDQKHPNRYLIINLSGIKYNYSLFNNMVIEYDWIDHQAPTIHLLFQICKKIYDYLIKDKHNVIVINCKAGKGRTGTIICSFLLFCGLFNNEDQAFLYYSKKRFNSGSGVSQPSQKRYVSFFSYVLKNKVYFPIRIFLEGMYLTNPPAYDNTGQLKPYYEICNDNHILVTQTNKKSYLGQRKIHSTENQRIIITDNDFSIPLAGDFTVNIKNNQMIKDKLIGRVSFNTAFVNSSVQSSYLEYEIKSIDPDNIVYKDNYKKSFVVSVSIIYNILYIMYNVLLILIA